MSHRLHSRQMPTSPSPQLSTVSSTTISMSETHTTSTTRPPSSQTGEPIYPPLMSGQVAYPVMAAVAGTTIILLLLAAFVSYQVRAIIRYRSRNTRNNNGNMNSQSSDSKRSESRSVQFTENSGTLLSRVTLPSSSILPPPDYTKRSPQIIVPESDKIQDEKNIGESPPKEKSQKIVSGTRGPQDHLKQAQLERVMTLHRKQMEELQELLQSHMKNSTQLLAPHAVVDIHNIFYNSQIESGARRKQRRNQRTYWWSKFIDHIQTQVHESPNPHGIDSPMVQPDDAVRGPEGIVYPLPPGHSDVSQSYPTSVATTRGSSNRASSASWEVGRGNEIKVEMEESRLAEYSTLVDRIEKINEHYERQFRIVETEILQGTSDYINDEARRNSSTLQE